MKSDRPKLLGPAAQSYFLAVAFILAATPAKAEWVQVDIPHNYLNLYYDAEIKRSHDGLLRFSILKDLKVPRNVGGTVWQSEVLSVEVNCRSRKKRETWYTAYAQQMGAGEALYSTGQVNTNWSQAFIGTTDVNLLETVCAIPSKAR
jgi:hypothetical protein